MMEATDALGRKLALGGVRAARIETEFGRPAEWLDQDHTDPLLNTVRRMAERERDMLAEVAKTILKAR